jgi:ATP phosphoribosyltransferase regulatory subunit
MGQLYEKYGYKKYKMAKFEPYDLYRENKNFLKTDGIITFMNADGRLMAMKPDVTMSIVKNTTDDVRLQKYYYIENVFRTSVDTHEFQEIKQMGLEFIGDGDGYSEAEVVSLAVKTLSVINGDYLLNLAHIGFISAFIGSFCFDYETNAKIYEALRHKNAAALKSLDGCKCAAGNIDKLYRLMTYSVPLSHAAAELEQYVVNDEMATALKDIQSLYRALKSSAAADNIKIDFSVSGDADYYNGIVFNGYIKTIPRLVLAGGRYDNLMKRFGKDQCAIGFALYLNELDKVLHKIDAYDTQALLIYGRAGADKVMTAVEALQKTYQSVVAVSEDEARVKPQHRYVLKDNGETERIK